MKRLFAIVILNIFLLNVLGYYGVLLSLKNTSGHEVAERLNSDMYDLGATVTFQVPLSVPYGTDQENYVPVSGEFEKDGVVYHMVKQRFYKDILYIVCIEDEKTTQINDVMADVAQGFAGQEDEQAAAPSLIKDYFSSKIEVAMQAPGLELDVVKASSPRYFLDSYFASIVHPPDRA